MGAVLVHTFTLPRLSLTPAADSGAQSGAVSDGCSCLCRVVVHESWYLATILLQLQLDLDPHILLAVMVAAAGVVIRIGLFLRSTAQSWATTGVSPAVSILDIAK